jgi:AcrR family transcriptional regulator
LTIDVTTSKNQVTPWAKQRILDTAAELFYDDGIRSVGVDRLISESAVTKATFYKHYGSKENLAVAYITSRHDAMLAAVTEIIEKADSPADAIRDMADAMVANISSPGFRGSAFMNAAVDFPDPSHPVRAVVSAHRDWITTVFSELLAAANHPMPGDGADVLMLAFDGAQGGGYAGDPVAATAALSRLVDRVLAAIPAA